MFVIGIKYKIRKVKKEKPTKSFNNKSLFEKNTNIDKSYTYHENIAKLNQPDFFTLL